MMCQHMNQALCKTSEKVRGTLHLECLGSSSCIGEHHRRTASPVSVEVLWEVLLHKVTAGSIIIEADLMAGVELAPGLHHGEHC